MQRRLVKEPVYRQLNRLLRERVRSQEFEDGDQFLTERQVCEEYAVSRTTANKALSNLVVEGVLEFRKGVGTFVRGGVLDYNLARLVSFTQKAHAVGKHPSTRVLQFEWLAADSVPADVARRLSPKTDEAAYYVERLRLADAVPVILERRHVAAHFCPELDQEALEGSLYELWTEHYGLELEGADQAIRAVSIRGEDAGLLDVRDGAPGLLVRSVGYVRGGVPLWVERTLYRADAYEFRNRLGPVRNARPAAGTLLDIDEQTA